MHWPDTNKSPQSHPVTTRGMAEAARKSAADTSRTLPSGISELFAPGLPHL